jgi:SAM-dependent methyltransferase
MIKREVFDTIGLLNEEYGIGAGEDTEFSIEAMEAGFEVRECVEKRWDPAGNINTGYYPIYHRGEGTVHDATLVPNWNEVFFNNSLKLAKKYNKEYYRWLLCNHFERAVFLKGDPIWPKYKYEHTRYTWASENLYGKKVLEIGCSTGYGIQYLPSDVDYTGLDYDKTIVKCAQEQEWGDNCKFVNYDINKYDLEQYDTIIAFEVIEHLPNGLEVVERLKKHCKRLLITVPRKEPPGFWGPHHLLHNLDETMFNGFKFKYITDNGLEDTPNDSVVSLMVCRWDRDE